MDARALAATKAVLLVLLLGFFLGSLVHGLIRQAQATAPPIPAQGAGRDPGIRVRLTNRRALMGDDLGVTDTAIFPEVQVRLRTPALLWAPDDGPSGPPERIRRLPAGTGLRLLAGVDGGMTIVVERQREWTWPVTRVRLEPADGDATRAPDRLRALGEEAPGRLAWIELGVRRLRGSLDVVRIDQKQLQALNLLPMEAYLEGVVEAEMGPTYPLEALKAQAIAARGMAEVRRQAAAGARAEFDVEDGTGDQQYLGQGSGAEPVRRAVLETRGIVLHDRTGQPFPTMYHASSGGFTAPVAALGALTEAEAALRRRLSASVLAAVADPAALPAAQARGALDTHWQAELILTPREISLALNRAFAAQGRTFDLVRNLQVGRRDPVSQRVFTVIVFHGNDRTEVLGETFRQAIGAQRLRSLLWVRDPERTVQPNGAVSWTIVSRGWGHGIGMSQVSTWHLAEQGRGAFDILQRFYGAEAVPRRLW